MTTRLVIADEAGALISASPDLWSWLGRTAPASRPARVDDLRAVLEPDMVMHPMTLDNGTTAHLISRPAADLARENRVLRETLETMDAAIVVYDADLRYVFGNQGYHDVFPHLPPDAELVGRRYEDVLRMSIRAGVHPDPRAVTDTETYVAERAAAIAVRANTVRTQFSPKTKRWWQLRAAWTPSGSRVSLRIDITAMKRLESELVSSQRAKTVAQISAGVAHHFNNLLSVVQGNIEMVLRAGPLPEPLGARLRRAFASAEEGARLTRQLLTFAQRDISEPRLIDVSAFLAELHPLLHNALGPRIALDIRTGEPPCRVTADPATFEAALMNLVLNARDAIEARPDRPDGHVRIEVRHDAVRDRGVVIIVSDNGLGMSAEVAREAFEPFFTTKGTGSASGLGLSQVYGFAVGAGGTASITSAPGDGTVIELRLPSA